jgi:hypothetical protein
VRVAGQQVADAAGVVLEGAVALVAEHGGGGGEVGLEAVGGQGEGLGARGVQGGERAAELIQGA